MKLAMKKSAINAGNTCASSDVARAKCGKLVRQDGNTAKIHKNHFYNSISNSTTKCGWACEQSAKRKSKTKQSRSTNKQSEFRKAMQCGCRTKWKRKNICNINFDTASQSSVADASLCLQWLRYVVLLMLLLLLLILLYSLNRPAGKAANWQLAFFRLLFAATKLPQMYECAYVCVFVCIHIYNCVCVRVCALEWSCGSWQPAVGCGVSLKRALGCTPAWLTAISMMYTHTHAWPLPQP